MKKILLGIIASCIVTTAITQNAIAVLSSNQLNNYVLDVSTVSARGVQVVSTGYCGGVESVSIMTVQDVGVGTTNSTPGIPAEAFNYAILCGGEFTFRGCGTIASTNGDALFHANGPMDNRGNTHALINLSSSVKISSGNVDFGGDITAPKFKLHNNADVLGTKTRQVVAPVEIPDIDLTPFFNWALAHGEVKNGDFSISSSYTPNGGILWVNGNAEFDGGPGTSVNGSIIATGSIHMMGQIGVSPSTCAFGIVSRDGDIQVTSSGALYGLVYAKTGSFEHTANGEIHGQIIVNGSIKKGGNSDIMTSYVVSVPVPPDGSGTDAINTVAAWQR